MVLGSFQRIDAFSATTCKTRLRDLSLIARCRKTIRHCFEYEVEILSRKRARFRRTPPSSVQSVVKSSYNRSANLGGVFVGVFVNEEDAVPFTREVREVSHLSRYNTIVSL